MLGDRDKALLAHQVLVAELAEALENTKYHPWARGLNDMIATLLAHPLVKAAENARDVK